MRASTPQVSPSRLRPAFEIFHGGSLHAAAELLEEVLLEALTRGLGAPDVHGMDFVGDVLDLDVLGHRFRLPVGACTLEPP